jgi:hypothetical protein
MFEVARQVIDARGQETDHAPSLRADYLLFADPHNRLPEEGISVSLGGLFGGAALFRRS